MWSKIIAVGHIGKSAELRFTPQGTPVCDFSLASNSGWGDSKTTTWFRVTIWNKLAESLVPYLLKGKQVLIEGELQVDPETGGPRLWVSSDGEAKASFEVTAREVRLLGGKTTEDSKVESNEEPEEDSEIPF